MNAERKWLEITVDLNKNETQFFWIRVNHPTQCVQNVFNTALGDWKYAFATGIILEKDHLFVYLWGDDYARQLEASLPWRGYIIETSGIKTRMEDIKHVLSCN